MIAVGIPSAWLPANKHHNELPVIQETSRQVCKTALSDRFITSRRAGLSKSLRIVPMTLCTHLPDFRTAQQSQGWITETYHSYHQLLGPQQ